MNLKPVPPSFYPSNSIQSPIASQAGEETALISSQRRKTSNKIVNYFVCFVFGAIIMFTFLFFLYLSDKTCPFPVNSQSNFNVTERMIPPLRS